MKILYFTNIATPYKSQQIQAWSRALGPGDTIQVVYLQGAIATNLWVNACLPENSKIPETVLAGGSLWSQIRQLFSMRKELLGSVVLIGGYYESWHWVLLGLCRLNAHRTVLVFDGINPRRIDAAGRWRSLIKRLFTQTCHAGLANGAVSRRYLVRTLGFRSEDVFEQALLSTPSRTESPSREEIESWKRRHGVPSDVPIVGFCGRLVERKRIQDIVTAFEDPGLSRQAKLVVIGDGPYREELLRVARSRGVDLRFVGAIPDRDELFLALASLEVLVLPSFDEPWGMVVNEALAVGTRVVVSDQCGCSEDLGVVGEAATVHPAGDVDSLRDGIRLQLSRGPAREEIASLSRRINCPERTREAFDSFLRAIARPRVLVFQPVVPPYRIAFFRGIVARGTDLRVISRTQEEIRGLEGVLHPASVSSLGREVLLWQAGWTQLFRRRWDSVVLWGNPRVLSNALVMAAALVRSTTPFWWGHLRTAGAPHWRLVWKRVLLRLVARRVVVYTLAERQRLVASGMDPAKVFGLNNTIDTEAVALQKGRWSHREVARFLKERWEIEPGYHLFAGRLTRKTGLFLLLEALSDHAVDTRLVVVGSGEMERPLRESVERMGLGDRVTFVRGTYLEEELAPLFLGARSFVYPGSVGLSLLHAMSYGVPAVLHDDASEQMPEYDAFKPGQNGLDFPKGDARALAEALVSLDADPELRERLSRGALSTIERDWTISAMVERFLEAVSPPRTPTETDTPTRARRDSWRS